MAGIYIHIPFCKQACHYCDFHFSTSLRYKNELLASLLKETELQKNYLAGEEIETIYFGGGTPSLLDTKDIIGQLEVIHRFFTVLPAAEITLETNPDDITEDQLAGWKTAGINRLSIGIQSFFEEDLVWMNRAHSAKQAIDSLGLASKHFTNITIDLIYGHPLLTNENWEQNVRKLIECNIPHISCYALTIEPKTPLAKMIQQKQKENIQQEEQAEQFLMLMDWLEKASYEHYEISNFAKQGFRSRHNSSYWQGRKYLGLGPSAHSYNGTSRQWNISNNNIYIRSLTENQIPFEIEELNSVQKLNEYILTSLRTSEGIDLNKLVNENPKIDYGSIKERSLKFIDSGKLVVRENKLILTKEGKLFADGIASELFF